MRTPPLPPSPWCRAAACSLAAALLIPGCDGGASDGAPAFAGEPLLRLAGTQGAVRASLRFDPPSPARGMNAAEYTIVDGAGQPVEGLALRVLPWMPDMGHGTSITPAVTAVGGGVFVVERLSLFMAGRWQLRSHLDGPASDELWPELQIP